MARLAARRSRAMSSDEDEDEGASRESTPMSTAPSDRKRMRHGAEIHITTPAREPRVKSRKSDVRINGIEQYASNAKNAQSRREHQPGAIVRVKLTNFVTYTSAEFFPGPNLNMVIGPNGTGKSTLVCAICLGLGFKTSLLGRAKDPGEFVKHGTKEAIIEIELQRATSGPNRTRNNPIIMRKIRKDDNKSTFSVDGEQVANQKVLDLCRGRFNIQVDNLCQFLPQDRVVEFAQMNPVEMLATTLAAAAGPSVTEMHGQLKALREHQQNLLGTNKGERERLESLEKKQDNDRVLVEQLKERIETKANIERLEKCRVIAKYMEAKDNASETRALKDTLSAEVTRLTEESGPALRKVNAKQQYAAEAKKNRDFRRKELERVEKECQRLGRQVTAHDTKMKECDERVQSEKRAVGQDKQELGRRRGELNALKAQKENVPEPFDSRAMSDEIAKYTRRDRELEQKGEELNQEAQKLGGQGRELKEKRSVLTRRVDALETQEGQRESRLETLSRDTFRAWQWVKENQNMFKKEVLGPPAVTCSLKDSRMAAQVEAAFRPDDFKILTVQCKEDFVTLQQELTKKQRLFDIRLRTCDGVNLPNFRPSMSDEQLRELGLEQWLLDCIEGPETVLAMLCQERKLHQIGLTSRDVSTAQHERIASSPLATYITKDKIFSFTRRAEYGAAGISSQVRDVREPRVWTDKPIDSGQKQEWTKQAQQYARDIMEIKNNIDLLREEINKIKAERTDQKELCDAVRQDKERKQKALHDYNQLDVKISAIENKIAQIDEKITSYRQRSLDILKEKDEAIFKKAEAVLEYCGSTHTLQELAAKLLEAEVILIEAQSDNENLQNLHQHIRDTLTRKIAERDAAKKRFEEARANGQRLKKSVEALNEEAGELNEQGQPELQELIMHMVRKASGVRDNNDEPGSTNNQTPGLNEKRDIDDEVEALEARLEVAMGQLGSEKTIKDFEERARMILRLREKLTDFRRDHEDSSNAIKEVRERFENELEPIIGQIDAAFSESFARIGCAGQVAIHKASSSDPADCTEEQGGSENGLDFAAWAIHISVKFRDNEPLSLLDSHRQSGGERAVSTIFYLMALQSLSRSPFRVVDEINQGMDPRNERMVHGRMVDIAAQNERARSANGGDSIGGGGGSQYFLITPKLLSGLRYDRGMTVLCIVSGENMPSATDVKRRDAETGESYVEKGRRIDFRDYARRARELGLGLGVGGGGRRVDSGVAMRGVGVAIGA